MNLEPLEDFVSEAYDKIGKFRVEFMLSPEQLSTGKSEVGGLKWDSINYGKAELRKIPDDKRGIYAFAVCEHNDILPPHGYIFYIGIAGRKSNRSLRARYKDYLNERKILKREKIAWMIGNWHSVLRFFFAPVDDTVTSDDLEKLEKKLNSALLPPCAVGDLEADIKRMRKAF